MARFLSITCLFLSLCSSSFSVAQPSPEVPTLAPVLKQIIPAIVNVAVQGVIPNDIPLLPDENAAPNSPPNPRQDTPDNNNEPRRFQSMGSGVIIDPEHGIILTNDHVIRHASIITITLNDGRRLTARMIGGDSA